METVVNLKHWQVFLILISSALIPSILPSIDKTISVLYFSFLIFWMYSITSVLSYKVLKEMKPKATYYKFSCIVLIIMYTSITFTTDYGLHISSNNYKEYGNLLWPLILLMLFMFCSIMYVFYFTAKTLSKANSIITGNSESITINYFFAFWFYIIGVWYIQPKLSKILNEK